jgi:hypothetical protein
MQLSKEKRHYLFALATHAKIYGVENRVVPGSFEDDKRKCNKAMRELAEAGYTAQGADGYHVVTSKILDEVPPEPLDLIKRWTERRSCYSSTLRRCDKPVVYLQDMSPGEKVWALTADIRWHLMDKDDGFISKPTALGAPMNELRASFKVGKSIPDLLECVSTQELTDHVNGVVGEEYLRQCMLDNVGRGFQEVLGLDAKEAVKFKATDTRTDWLGRSSCDLGDDMTKWGQVCEEQIAQVRIKIQYLQETLKSLEFIRDKVAADGGWEVFQTKLRELIEADLESIRHSEPNSRSQS